MDDLILEKKLEDIKKEFVKKQRKLKKSLRASKAKAHVQRKLKEQQCLEQLSRETEISIDEKLDTSPEPINDSSPGHGHYVTDKQCEEYSAKSDIPLDENKPQYHVHAEDLETVTNASLSDLNICNSHIVNMDDEICPSSEQFTNFHHGNGNLSQPVDTISGENSLEAKTNPTTHCDDVKCSNVQTDESENVLLSQDIFESQPRVESTCMVNHSQHNQRVVKNIISNEKQIEGTSCLHVPVDSILSDKTNITPINTQDSSLQNRGTIKCNSSNSPSHMDTVNKYKTKNIVTTKLKSCASVSETFTSPELRNISSNFDRLSLRKRRLKANPKMVEDGSQELSLPSSIESSTDSGTNTMNNKNNVQCTTGPNIEVKSVTNELLVVSVEQISNENEMELLKPAPKGAELSSKKSSPTSHSSQHQHQLNVESDQAASQSSSSQLYSQIDEDYKSEGPNEETICRKSRSGRRSSNSRKRRRSTRLEEPTSQGSSSQNSQLEISQPSRHKHPRSNAATKKQLIVTSIFQCLVDEGKRDKANEGFNLPVHYREQSNAVDKNVEHGNLNGDDSFKEQNDNQTLCSHSGKLNSTENSSKLNAFQSSTKPTIQDSSDYNIKGSDAEIDRLAAGNSNCSVRNGNLIRNISASKSCSDPSILKDEHRHTEETRGHHVTTRIMELSEKSEDISPALFSTPTTSKKFVFPETNVLPFQNLPNDKQLRLVDTSPIKAIVNGCEEQRTNNAMERIVTNEAHSAAVIEPVLSTPEIKGRKLDDGTRHSGEATINTEGVGDETQTLSLQQVAIFQVPKGDPLLSFVAGETEGTEGCGGRDLFVICLCTMCLKIYKADGGTCSWKCCYTERLNVMVKRNSGCQMHIMPDVSKVCVILQQPLPEYTEVTAYTYNNNNNMSRLVLDQVWSRSVYVHPLTDTTVIVSNYHAGRTFVSRYTVCATGRDNRLEFDEAPGLVKTFATVAGLQGAVIGLSNTGMLHIWNSDLGYLLTSVDISDVCPYESLCPGAYLEEGYLFLPVLVKTRGKDVGSVLVLNPQMASSETLTPLQAWSKKWTGCTKASIINQDLLVARESCGNIGIWDIFSGHHLATLNDTNFTSFATTTDHVFVTHKQCVHVYRLTAS